MSGTNLKKSWDKLVLELDKCQLLCRNCHCELHAQEYIIKSESKKPKVSNYDRKTIHAINCKKLGKKPSL
jgi:hypothetical protein